MNEESINIFQVFFIKPS